MPARWSPVWRMPDAATFAPLWPALEAMGFAGEAELHTVVAAAAVFTTGDVVAEMADLAPRVEAAHPTTIDDLAARVTRAGS